ncbi:hypothetical protein I2485_11075 [Nesterenkonia sp. E16_7]|uniref:hypothetical protein n=1 Tax=unclassified Nesterenkonia TaxID=2629769 RepID=UPI001A92408D|nr:MULTISPECIES: hypothetical protein [unclassified Nesterenkonia]MBO0595368.1 hypothetical protein [Nesterenkonia sp. E16_10]MBO0599184.1 hypothetical protein [Nesterenkonia sp. E16_7]
MHPLPKELTGRAFTAAEALRGGVPRERLRRKDIVALGAGVYAVRVFVARRTPRETLQLKAAALLRERPDAWLSHSSAAQIHGLWLPNRLLTDHRLHLSHAPEPGLWTRRQGVCGHRVSAGAQNVTTRGGVRVSSPGRTWLDLASLCSVRELIILGDQLVRLPYQRFESRREPHTTPEELAALVDRSRGVPGRRRCLAALTWVRVGADSIQETLLRLALIRAGLPEPELQVPAQPGHRWSPRADLGYPVRKIAIQYEGDTHFTPQQQRADQRRDNIFLAEGWKVLRFNSEDSREGFQRAAAQVRAALGGLGRNSAPQ